MIEFVKLIVDVVLKAVPGIVSRNERDKAAYLGADLFLLYAQINDHLLLGTTSGARRSRPTSPSRTS